MKSLIAVLSLILTFGAFADEYVKLDSSNIHLNAANGTIVRTESTPKKVKLTLEVPMAYRTCSRYEQRRSGQICHRMGTRCVVRGYRYGGPHRPGYAYSCRNYGNYGYVYRCEPTYSTYCAEYNTNTSIETKKVVVKFKNAYSGDEEYNVSVKQNRVDGISSTYTLTPANEAAQNRRIKRGFLKNRFKVK